MGKESQTFICYEVVELVPNLVHFFFFLELVAVINTAFTVLILKSN